MLRKRTLPLPRAVISAPGGEEEDLGFVVPSFTRGALLLRDADGRHHRLSWGEVESEAPGADRRRGLPPGEYAVTGYRIVETAEDGTEWHVSATARKIRTLVVKEGVTVQAEFSPDVRITGRAVRKGLQVAIQGEGGAGLSIYEGDRRIPIAARLVDPDGRELARGEMRYG